MDYMLKPQPIGITEVRRLRNLLALCDVPMDAWRPVEDCTIWSIMLAKQAYYYEELLAEPPIVIR